MVEHYIIKVIAEPLTTTIALILSGFSAGVSVVFLVDFFKRHAWQYKKKPKKPEKDSPSPNASTK